MVEINKVAFKLTIVIFVLLLSGCCLNRDTYFLPDKVKEYVSFKTDSFWIYSDQNGRIDTFRITNSNIGIGKEGRESCDEAEYISVDYFSSFSDKKLYAIGSGSLLKPTDCLGKTIPWIWADRTAYSQKYLQDSLVLNGNSFYAIYICEFPDPEYAKSYNLPFRYLLAKDVGIIEKEYADGSVFSIVKYNIEK